MNILSDEYNQRYEPLPAGSDFFYTILEFRGALSETPVGVREQWVYLNLNYLYYEGGIVNLIEKE